MTPLTRRVAAASSSSPGRGLAWEAAEIRRQRLEASRRGAPTSSGNAEGGSHGQPRPDAAYRIIQGRDLLQDGGRLYSAHPADHALYINGKIGWSVLLSRSIPVTMARLDEAKPAAPLPVRPTHTG